MAIHGMSRKTASSKGFERRRQILGRSEISALESRTLFAAAYPTPAEQYLLELINRARANPTAEVARTTASGVWPAGLTPDLNEGIPAGTISANPKQPLAMNPYLLDAARKHTVYLFANPNTPDAHVEVVNGVKINYIQREIAAGYPLPTSSAENIWTAVAVAGQDDILDDLRKLEQEPFVDDITPGRGHRLPLMNPGINEVGLGMGDMADGLFIKHRVTQEFGNAGQTSFLCGIAYNDINKNQFYEPGEELANVTITATRTTDNAVFSTTTWASGGYSLPLAPGTYTVTSTGGNIGIPAQQTVTITTQNVEADFLSTNAPPLAAPTIATQPSNQAVNVNRAATFTVAANGTPPPTVQWQVQAPGQTTFAPIPNATGLSLTVNATAGTNGNQYQAVVTNSQGTVTSTAATLTVNGVVTGPQLNVTTNPVDQSVNAGDTVTFTSAGVGYISVQWSVSTDGGNTFNPVAVATNPTLTFVADPSQDGSVYMVTYSSATGSATASAGLFVNATPTTPTVTAQPQNQTAQDGTATLNVLDEGYPAPTVQWQTEAFGSSTFTDVSGATSPSLTVEAPAPGKVQKYRATITNGNGSVTTKVVTVNGNKRTPLSNDVTSLQTATRAALAAVNICKNATLAAQEKLSADLKRLKASVSARFTLGTLSHNEHAARAMFTRNESKLLNRLNTLAMKVNRDSIHVQNHPGDSVLANQLQTDLSALQSAAASTTAPADATDCKLATVDQLAPISAVAPTDVRLQNDVLAAQINAYTIGQTLQAPMVIAQDVVNQIAADA